MSIPGHAAHLEPLDRIAAGVAHYFNNLLTPIQAYSSMELARVAPHTGLADSLREIVAAAERGAEITQKLLACTSQQIQSPSSLDVHSHLVTLIPSLYALVPHPITLHLELVPHLPKLIVDPSHLTEIIVQLVANARDAIPKAGCVQISTALEDVLPHKLPSTSNGSRPGLHIRITVTDSGLGMTREIAARAFEPFYTTKESTRALGLGLSVARGIVQQHHGWIEVETAPYRGSSFHVLLPAEAPISPLPPLLRLTLKARCGDRQAFPV